MVPMATLVNQAVRGRNYTVLHSTGSKFRFECSMMQVLTMLESTGM